MKTLTILFVAAIMMGVGCSKSEDNENNPDKPDKPSPLPDLPDPNDVCSCMDDIIFMQYCYDNFDVNKDGKVSQIEAAAVSEIDLTDFEIKTLTGIGYFSNLEILNCKGCKNLISVDLSNNLKIRIGKEMFYKCSSLTKIIFPKNVTEIGESAFYGCSSLTKIILPTNIVGIGEYAFSYCTKLINIDLPETVTKLGVRAFADCDNLTNISIPGKVTEIGVAAFSGCRSLEKINIPETVTKIGGGAFRECSSLTDINIPEKVTGIEDGTFYSCSSLVSIGIPKTVTKIGDRAFSGCSSLERIDIPEKVTKIGEYAFQGCSSLTSINIPKEVIELKGCIFEGCSSLSNVIFAKGAKLKLLGSISRFADDNTKGIFMNCPALTSIEIPASVETIGHNIFENCPSLTNVTFEKKSQLKSIINYYNSDYAIFENCSALTSIEIPASVETMQGLIFYNCSSLVSVTFEKESQLESIMGTRSAVFTGCTALTSIEIPASIKEITNIVYNCNNLTHIYCYPIVPPEITYWDCKNFALYVPSQSIEAYKNSSWSNYYSSIRAIE